MLCCKYTTLISCFPPQTYEEILNLGAYDKKKYSRVEDLGDEDAGPSEEVVKKAAAKRLGKWSSARR